MLGHGLENLNFLNMMKRAQQEGASPQQPQGGMPSGSMMSGLPFVSGQMDPLAQAHQFSGLTPSGTMQGAGVPFAGLTNPQMEGFIPGGQMQQFENPSMQQFGQQQMSPFMHQYGYGVGTQDLSQLQPGGRYRFGEPGMGILNQILGY